MIAIETLRDKIRDDTQRIPDFIDGKFHYRIYIEYQLVLIKLSKLVSSQFLSDRSIAIIRMEVYSRINTIEKNSMDNPSLYFTILTYIDQKINKYKRWALEMELYETVANIENFIKMNDEK